MPSRLRIALGLLTLSVCGLSTACGSSKRRPPAASTAAAASSQTTPTPSLVTSSTTAVVQSPASAVVLGLTPALEDEIARTFAPQLRFNAYHNDGNTSKQNRNEDYFPMSVLRFLKEIDSGQARVAIQESQGAQPAISEVRTTTKRPVFKLIHLADYPKRMVGDPPGAAPLYVEVYEDPALRNQAPDGSGELTAYIEYWVFYAHDRAEARVLLFNTGGRFDPIGHRADWEHTSFKVRVKLGPGGVVTGGAIEEGVFYGHNKAFLAFPPQLTLLDDNGVPDPQGTHVAVFIAQGKHASYPEAGHWTDHAVPGWLAKHTDFFRGNGVWVDSWRGRLINLDEASTNDAEFDPPEFQSLQQGSNAPLLPDWTEYTGKWGPDLSLFNALGITITVGLSPTGPKRKSTFQAFHGGRTPAVWTDAKVKHASKLSVYADLGISIPRALGVAPVRR